MAIAFDAQSASAFSGAPTVTWSHTCTGSNLVLRVGIYATIDNCSGVTYNGVAMTLVTKLNVTGTQYIYVFYLINPATGAHNCVASVSSGNIDGYGAGTSYTGARQSSQPEAFNTNVSASTTSFTTNVTTVTANAWVTGWGYGQTASAGASTTFRSQPVAQVLFMMDRNAAVTPAGSYGLNFTQAANFAGAIVESIAEVGAVPPAGSNTGFFNLS